MTDFCLTLFTCLFCVFADDVPGVYGNVFPSIELTNGTSSLIFSDSIRDVRNRMKNKEFNSFKLLFHQTDDDDYENSDFLKDAGKFHFCQVCAFVLC